MINKEDYIENNLVDLEETFLDGLTHNQLREFVEDNNLVDNLKIYHTGTWDSVVDDAYDEYVERVDDIDEDFEDDERKRCL
jgi:hypothetical protein